MNDTIYTRRDSTSIYEYLKEKAKDLSGGRWTDFSSGDIGSVLLGLMAYLADANNFQIDKAASELYLDTAVERTSIMSLLKLIGYEPRHYESAYTTLKFKNINADPGSTVIQRYSTFTNAEGTIVYTALDPIQINNGVGFGLVYEGTRSFNTYKLNQITPEGRIYLPDYKLGMNTIQVSIPSISSDFINKVEDVRFVAGEFAYSAHVDEFARVYIQLPSYWTDLLDDNSSILISYLLTQGEAGRVGDNILVRSGQGLSLMQAYTITNPEASEGGYFPETVSDLKISAPRHARTMNTIVTKKDLEDLVTAIPEVASIKAGDYNDAWTGFIQPQDAYKCKVLAVPLNPQEISLYSNGEPTLTCTKLMNFVNSHRLATLNMYFEDPQRVVPDIKINLYTEESDLRASSIAMNVENFMKAAYNREYLTIGKSLYGSIIGRDLLNTFTELTYLEVVSPENSILVPANGYIDMYYARFKIYVNDVLKINEWNDGEEVQ